MEGQIRIALAGNPNSGKTTLFNKLTGANQFVGNWPGVTVEKKEGKLKKHHQSGDEDLGSEPQPQPDDEQGAQSQLGHSVEPRHQGHQRLKPTEPKAHDHHVLPLYFTDGQPFADGHGEGVHGKAYRQNEQFNYRHISFLPSKSTVYFTKYISKKQ